MTLDFEEVLVLKYVLAFDWPWLSVAVGVEVCDGTWLSVSVGVEVCAGIWLTMTWCCYIFFSSLHLLEPVLIWSTSVGHLPSPVLQWHSKQLEEQLLQSSTYLFIFRKYYGCSSAGFSIPSAEHRYIHPLGSCATTSPISHSRSKQLFANM